MKDLLMMRGAATLVDVCTQVKQGDSVLVVTDMHKVRIMPRSLSRSGTP